MAGSLPTTRLELTATKLEKHSNRIDLGKLEIPFGSKTSVVAATLRMNGGEYALKLRWQESRGGTSAYFTSPRGFLAFSRENRLRANCVLIFSAATNGDQSINVDLLNSVAPAAPAGKPATKPLRGTKRTAAQVFAPIPPTISSDLAGDVRKSARLATKKARTTSSDASSFHTCTAPQSATAAAFGQDTNSEATSVLSPAPTAPAPPTATGPAIENPASKSTRGRKRKAAHAPAPILPSNSSHPTSNVRQSSRLAAKKAKTTSPDASHFIEIHSTAIGASESIPAFLERRNSEAPSVTSPGPAPAPSAPSAPTLLDAVPTSSTTTTTTESAVEMLLDFASILNHKARIDALLGAANLEWEQLKNAPATGVPCAPGNKESTNAGASRSAAARGGAKKAAPLNASRSAKAKKWSLEDHYSYQYLTQVLSMNDEEAMASMAEEQQRDARLKKEEKAARLQKERLELEAQGPAAAGSTYEEGQRRSVRKRTETVWAASFRKRARKLSAAAVTVAPCN